MIKVRYTGDYYKVIFDKSETYEVVSIEDGLYRIYVEAYEDYFLFPPTMFEVVEE